MTKIIGLVHSRGLDNDGLPFYRNNLALWDGTTYHDFAGSGLQLPAYLDASSNYSAVTGEGTEFPMGFDVEQFAFNSMFVVKHFNVRVEELAISHADGGGAVPDSPYNFPELPMERTFSDTAFTALPHEWLVMMEADPGSSAGVSDFGIGDTGTLGLQVRFGFFYVAEHRPIDGGGFEPTGFFYPDFAIGCTYFSSQQYKQIIDGSPVVRNLSGVEVDYVGYPGAPLKLVKVYEDPNGFVCTGRIVIQATEFYAFNDARDPTTGRRN